VRRVALVAVLVALAACSSSKNTAKSLPQPVQFRQTPDGITLDDPSFTPLPGARADFGHLGGSVYQIEIPEHWNHKLVLFMHGFGQLAKRAAATPPRIRHYFIGHGYAWGASSFSSTSLIPGRAADETAALWDYFARKHGRPERSYVTGASMGGAATNIAAERYGNRFDGALALCGAASQAPAVSITADFFAAGAYAAGVKQADYDHAANVSDLVNSRIRPALRDPAEHLKFEDLYIQLSGGPRAFDREGFRMEENTNWSRAAITVGAGLVDNHDTTYPDPAFNRGAIRLRTNAEARRAFLAGNETTGNLQIPLLTLHSTGDGQVPINQAQIYQREVDAAGKSDLMVQRVIRDPGHCGFNDEEIATNFEALVAWVEHGTRPQGTNVMVDDLNHLDHTYEIVPRPESPDDTNNAVPGASDRATLSGAATLDGRPFDAQYMGVVVIRPDGLVTACQLTLPTIANGRYEIGVLADAEGAGCGAPGARVVPWTFAKNEIIHSMNAVPWPGNGQRATANLTFASAAPDGAKPPLTQFSGDIYNATGDALSGGTKVEAFVGDTLCGVASTRYTGSFTGYILSVVGPTSVAGCAKGAPLQLRVDGKPVAKTATNDLKSHESFDLTTG